jgi:hypothetical protein
MTFEEWYEENFGAVEPGVPFHLPVLKFAYESGAKKREWVGLDGDIPGLGLVTEEFYNGMIFAEDILREKNT